MKKIKLYALAAAVLAFGLAGCTKEKPTDGEGPVDGGNKAYVSVTIPAQKLTRASTEAGGPENGINSIYLITFAGNNLVAIPNGGNFIRLTGAAASLTPEAQLIAGTATNMVVLVNPGPKMVTRLESLGNGVAYGVFNAAIQEATAADIANGDGSTGYTMISTKRDYSGDPVQGMPIGSTIDNAFIDITGHMVLIGSDPNAAKQQATEHPVNVLVERLASKLSFKTKQGGVSTPNADLFEYGNWTVDAVNSRYFPFAVKTMLSINHAHTPSFFYWNNFYTEDPNYGVIANLNEALASGIVLAEIVDYSPVLPWNNYYNWLSDTSDPVYAVENTMGGVSNGQALAQQFGNATRVIFKGTYIPKGMSTAAGERDWFQFAGINYDNLAALKAKYALGTDTGFEAACDAFAAKISGGTVAFADLTEANLTTFGRGGLGGEVAKVPVDGVGIRWFQNGLNYWYYEIKHNNDESGFMVYGKYGIVRNNQYNMNLASISGNGTPWYPDLRDPGDGDPKPEDPIDKASGYIGVEIEVADWILWEADVVI